MMMGKIWDYWRELLERYQQFEFLRDLVRIPREDFSNIFQKSFMDKLQNLSYPKGETLRIDPVNER